MQLRPQPEPSGKGPVITPVGDTTAGKWDGTADRPCLFLLFDEGSRPTADSARSAMASGLVGHVSHDPGRSAQFDQATSWIELLLDGLTFDLLGLAPGKALSLVKVRHRFGLTAEAIAGCEAIGIAPGPHLRGAANALPVVRTLLRLAITLANQWVEAKGALWTPAASVMERRIFIQAVDTWLGGGPFPALGLAGIAERPDGLLASDGLAFFTGQELLLDRQMSANRVAGTRLLVRLIDALVGHAALTREVRLSLDDEPSLCLRPAGSVICVAYG